MIRIILQDRDVALLRALPRAKVLTLAQIHKYFFKERSEKAARRVLTRLEKAGFITNLRSNMKYAVSVNYSIWTLGRNGFSYLGMRPYRYHASTQIFHQLKMNDVMMEFFDQGINKDIYWSGDGENVYETELGNIRPDAVLKNSANGKRIFFEFDNSSKPKNPLIKNLEKYIVWFLSSDAKNINLHYCVSRKNRESFIRQCFHTAFLGLREKYHIHQDQLIPLEVSFEEFSSKQLTNSIHSQSESKNSFVAAQFNDDHGSQRQGDVDSEKRIQMLKENNLPESLFS
ncbi:MAG: replication-relaxation family protein [Deltaproteobacteria bacterium]|nr:replication-relaxation family protein [Deltaproteobacteria bacterium]